MAACRSSRPESIEMNGIRSAISAMTPPTGSETGPTSNPARTAAVSTASDITNTRGDRRGAEGGFTSSGLGVDGCRHYAKELDDPGAPP